ncbi:hypothetical protein GCM10011391_39300 [Pullulanibacillus camelliae]|uniref:Uncharacterized protein n=1 Tax=Pullulanibacillus camelliae TaxID=1707096 RepID=A0A8J2YNC5_9BACL|nr:hypothetical protein [Pullulanibacillus camelliae]GGE56530.1 hypothetical protein GCM10011391_39300 [Pullulanibacillus camelliae]
MSQDTALSLAQKIIQLDMLRDELYEQLILISGNQAADILRVAQNA